jgi:hypothetical protein
VADLPLWLLTGGLLFLLCAAVATAVERLAERAWLSRARSGAEVRGAATIVCRPSFVTVSYEVRTDSTSVHVVARGPRGCLVVAACAVAFAATNARPLTAPLRGEQATIEPRALVRLALQANLAVFMLALGTLRVDVFAEAPGRTTYRRRRLGVNVGEGELPPGRVDALEVRDDGRVVLVTDDGEHVVLFDASYLGASRCDVLQDDLDEVNEALDRLREA